MALSKFERKPCYSFLFRLRDSGVCNMFESPTRLASEFNISKSEAEEIVLYWMNHCSELAEDYKDEDEEETEEDDEEECTGYWCNEGKYEKEYRRLYSHYVPDSGPATTDIGNLLRVISKISYRYYNDGDKDMSMYDWILKESPIPHDIPREFYNHFGHFSDEHMNKMIDIAVEYCLAKESEKFDSTDSEEEEDVTEKKKHLDAIGTSIRTLKLKQIRTLLSRKNVKALSLKDNDIKTAALDGLRGHIADVKEENVVTNASSFGKMITFLASKGFLTGKDLKKDLGSMTAEYPRTKALLASLSA